MSTLASLAPLLAQAEREVAALAEAVARLYDTPVTDVRTQVALQRRRAELDHRLAEARLRALKIQLTMTEHEYNQVVTALQQERQKLSSAETEYRRAQARLAAVRERHGALETQERSLHDRRRDLLRKMEAQQAALGAPPPRQQTGMSA